MVSLRSVYVKLNSWVYTKTFVLLLLYLGVIVFITPSLGRSLPYSMFYVSDGHRDYLIVQQNNEQRLQKAISSLKGHNCSKHCIQRRYLSASKPEFCFVIVSVSRPASANFLTQVVAALLPQVVAKNIVLTVYNAEGSSHKEALRLSNVVPVDSRKEKDAHPRYEKEKVDYIRALEWCYIRKAKFTVVLEDDALPRTDFMERLQLILDRRMSKKSQHWAFLKLYYPEKWQGWANEGYIIIELIICFVLGGLVLTTFVHFVLFAITCSLELGSETVVQLVLSTGVVAYMLVTLGRPHWIALRGINPSLSAVVNAPGCCTPAVLYPHAHMLNIIRHLKATECTSSFPVDLALDDFADKRGLKRLLAVPNLVRHIGYVSTLPGKGWKNPREFGIK